MFLTRLFKQKKKMRATVSVICFKAKKLSNGESPIMVRITKDRKTKYKSLGISVNPEHWDFAKNRPKPNCPNGDYILKIILDKEAEYQKKILELKSEEKEFTASTLIAPEIKVRVNRALNQKGKMEATINIICYKSKMLKNGEYPLMIRVCKDNKVKYKSIGISVKHEYWDFSKNKPKTNCPNRDLINKIILDKELEFQKQILELVTETRNYQMEKVL